MIKFGKEHKLNFPYLIGFKTQTIARSYGVSLHPDPFLFDKRRLVYHGRINDAVDPQMSPKIPIIEDNIKRLLSEMPLKKISFLQLDVQLNGLASHSTYVLIHSLPSEEGDWYLLAILI